MSNTTVEELKVAVDKGFDALVDLRRAAEGKPPRTPEEKLTDMIMDMSAR